MTSLPYSAETPALGWGQLAQGWGVTGRVLKAVVMVRSVLGHKSDDGSCSVGPPKGAFIPLGTGQRSPGGSYHGFLALLCMLSPGLWEKFFLPSWEVGSELG